MSCLHNNSGITLLEVLVSMIILAFGILGLAPMVVMSVEGNVISRDNTVASNLVKQKVEYFEGLSVMPSMPYSETETDLESNFSRRTTIDSHTSDTLVPSGVYQLAVEVTWTDNQNIQRTSSITTFILES